LPKGQENGISNGDALQKMRIGFGGVVIFNNPFIIEIDFTERLVQKWTVRDSLTSCSVPVPVVRLL